MRQTPHPGATAKPGAEVRPRNHIRAVAAILAWVAWVPSTGCGSDDGIPPGSEGGTAGASGGGGSGAGATGGSGPAGTGGAGGGADSSPRDAETSDRSAGDARNDPPDAAADNAGRPDAADDGRTADGGRGDGGADGSTGQDGGPAGWTLVWSDEFNGPSGAAVDGSKWNLVNKGDGFGNNELEFYTNRTENSYQDGNGSLVIKAIKETYMGREYTSARLESKGKFERAYGRFEARMQLPRGQGIWPAFWMLGNDIGSVSWPTCGEIDIMENIGKEPSILHGSLHGPGYSGGSPLGNSYTLPNGQKFADAFHVFAVEWETNVIRFYVDDTLYGTKTSADVPSGARWVYDHAFYILLNVAVGGTWPGSPDATTVFPQTMLVDYVRVYARPANGGG